ncbi:MAG: hypothetical protein Q9165_006740 [Trypethelium subeluteriae]
MASQEADELLHDREGARDQMNEQLSQAILGNTGGDEVDKLLYKLCFGHTSPELAAADLFILASSSSDANSIVSNLSDQILSLACDYPFLQPHLAGLIKAILLASPSEALTLEVRTLFAKEFSITTGDYAQSNHGLLFEPRHRTRVRIQEHINLHRLFARLLGEVPDEGLVHIEDAFYIISTALEDHPESHNAPNIDIPAAAQYMIWAGKVFLKGCREGDDRSDVDDTISNRPIWRTRGLLWTGKLGLSMDRWGFWKTRFMNVKTGTEEVLASTKEAATLAVRAMDLAEKTQP